MCIFESDNVKMIDGKFFGANLHISTSPACTYTSSTHLHPPPHPLPHPMSVIPKEMIRLNFRPLASLGSCYLFFLSPNSKSEIFSRKSTIKEFWPYNAVKY